MNTKCDSSYKIVIKFMILILMGLVTIAKSSSLDEAYKAHLEAVRIADSALSMLSIEISPIPDSALILEKSPINDLHKIFNLVWKPDSIDVLGNFESWGLSDAYKKSKYILIQNKLPFAIVDDAKIDSIAALSYFRANADFVKRDTIKSFRPANNRIHGRSIYLSQEIIDSLADFLEMKTQPSSSAIRKYDINEYWTNYRRGVFLRELLVLVDGHNGGWMLPSFPWVEEVLISASGNVAYAKFVVRYQGGTAKFVKSNGVWTIKSSKQTWIQ